MVAKRSHDYEFIMGECVKYLEAGTKPEWQALADKLGISSSTLAHVFKAKHIKHPKDLLSGAQAEIPTYNKLEDGDKVDESHTQNTNEYKSVSISGQIASVDDLVKHCKIDLAKYVIVNPEFRKWDVTVKLRRGEYDEVVTIPQIYIAFKTIAKNPIAIHPVVSPIEIKQGPKPKAQKTTGKTRRALIVPDVHIGFRRRLHTQELTPFHDRRVLDLILQIAQDETFDDIVFIGDCLDFSEFSTKFTPEPEFYFTTQPALIEWAWWLSEFLRLAPNARIVQHEGNHDKRLTTMITSQMMSAYELRAIDELELPPALSTDKLLALHKLNIEYLKGYPDNTMWLNRNVLIRHGDKVRGGSGDSAKAVINSTTYSTIFGHIHRREYVSRRIKSRDGDIIQHSICPGCACHIDGRVPGSTSEQQWQQGFAVVEYTDTIENIIPVSIDNGVMIYGGGIYKARDRDAEMDKMILASLSKIE